MSLTGPELPARLGKNLNGYLGETIEVSSVLNDCVALAERHGWNLEDIPVNNSVTLATLKRPGSVVTPAKVSQSTREPRVYISAGIHGDEPAGPLAIRQLLQENNWPAGVGIWLCPCLNPDGFIHNRRENANGADLNRQYLDPQTPETLAHISWLEHQPGFDLCLCLHEDWEAHGFYIYELNPENRGSLAAEIVNRVSRVCPIDHSELIEGRPAKGGVIRPNIDPRDRPQWPESFYLLSHKTRLSYTLEAPSDFPLSMRVSALVTGVNTALESIDVQTRDGS
jgi:murein peptide amidase A